MEVVRPNPKYSLAMIVRNCAADLEVCLASYGKYPDEIVIVNTGVNEDEEGFKETNAVAEKYGAKIFHFPWIEDFAAARNFSFARTSHPFVMWLDSDDSVENPAETDASIRKALAAGGDLLFMEYLYQFDQFGNCITMQKRERVVRKECFEWRAPIHECMCAIKQVVPVNVPPKYGRIIHRRQREDVTRANKSYRRNLKVFIEQYEKKGKTPELRMVFYWANTLFGMGDFHGAIAKYEEYIARSAKEGNKSDAEQMQARVSLAEAYSLVGKADEAEAALIPALALSPNMPAPYLILATLAFHKGQMERAVMYAQRVLEVADKMEMQLVANPREIMGRPHWIMAVAAAQAGQIEAAKSEIEKARKWYQGDPQFAELAFHIEKAHKGQHLAAAWGVVRDALIAEGRKDELARLAEHAPSDLADTADINRYTPKARPQGKRSIAFVCMQPTGMPSWGPWSIKDGTGGSEEAVINMSREFAKRGWHVEVYCATGKPCKAGPWKDEHGVLWYRVETWAGEFDNPVDVAVSWRSPLLFKASGVNAGTTYLWLHDICNPAAWAAELETYYDGYLLLSKYHRSLYPFIPEERVIYTANGVDPDLFVPLEDLTNEPHRMVWGSDPSRGLQYLLPWWEQIKKEVPDAQIDIFYGWSPLYLAHMASDPWHKDVHRIVESHRQKDGVNWWGKVGQQDLNKAFARASVWPYLTSFPEIHCITALKKQAHGVTPIVVDDFALSETVQFGEKLAGKAEDLVFQKHFIDRVIHHLKNPASREQRLEMARWARSKTWAALAEQWEGEFTKRLAAKRETVLA